MPRAPEYAEYLMRPFVFVEGASKEPIKSAASASAGTSGPWSPHVHPLTLVVVVAAVLCYVLVTRGDDRATPRQHWCFATAMLALLIAGSWPLEDLAAHWSLTALIVQRLLLVLVVAPMLLLALPEHLAGRLTRPRLVDSVVAMVSRPVVAVVVFTAVAIGTLVTPAVAVQNSSAVARTLLDALLLSSGFVLWAPVISRIPGATRPTPVGRAVYLFVQSVIPGFPSIIFIFAHHPLYPGFEHVHQAFRISPLVDQQLAGVIAKVSTLPVLWSAAWKALSDAQRSDREGIDANPLTWEEVKRQLERVERAERAGARRAHSSAPRPLGPLGPFRPFQPFDSGSEGSEEDQPPPTV
ncbi:MAG: cytochrome c oxidase assembly protein [Acidimicrobiales bacterium]